MFHARATGDKNSIITAMAREEIITFGDVVLIVVTWIKRQELSSSHLFNDKIVVDAMNR